MKVRKGDTVKIISGDDKGKTGKVLKVFPAMNKVLVDGVNIIKRHQRATRQGQKGQVVDKVMPVHVSNVAVVDKVAKPTASAKASAVKKAKVKVETSK